MKTIPVFRVASLALVASLCALSPGVLAAGAHAGNATAGACLPQLRDGWVRMAPGGGMAMMAGFGRIENHCPREVTVVRVDSPAFSDVSLHQTRIVDGISRMRPVPELHVPANGEAVLAPGGLHLMLMDPTTPLKAGNKVRMEFRLQDGRIVAGEFELRPAAP